VTRYFDITAANERVVMLRPVLEALRDDRDTVARSQRRLEQLHSVDGGPLAEVEHEQAEVVSAVRRMEAAVRRIDAWGVTLRDIDSGLVDLPALANGRPIWLCWRLGEDEIGWWHDLEAGLAGRKPLIEME
jgi:hypothetical protein